MSRLIPAAERIVRARKFIQQARDLPVPSDGERNNFSYIAQVRDLLRQARDMVKFMAGINALADSGLIGDWATQSAFYQPNLAVVHMGDLLTMGPDEAAFAVNSLIKPTMVIPEHANQVSTSGGRVNAGTLVERFMRQVRPARVIIPLSGIKIYCDGQGNCRQG